MKLAKRRRLLMTIDSIPERIHEVRGQRIMLDADLALLYGVTTSNLNLAVRRNQKRFPEDFMFQLTPEETQNLILQSAISRSWGGRRHTPNVFTEQGVAMLSGILRSDRAIEVNLAIMRAFVQMRQMLTSNARLARKLEELENKLIAHDYQIEEIIQAIRGLMLAPGKPTPPIGYKP
jgi:hypothetical protein